MYKRLYLLPGISILAIVLNHTVSYGIYALTSWSYRYQELLPPNYDPLKTPEYQILYFVKEFLLFGVPSFYFISGVFVTYSIDKSTGNIRWENIKKRIIGLLIPFLIWTIVSIIFNAGLGEISSPLEYFLQFFLIGWYWFIPGLILFYLISPWLITMAKRNWKLLLFLFGILQIIPFTIYVIWVMNLHGEPANNLLVEIIHWSFVGWIFYFPLGVVFSLHRDEFSKWMFNFRWIICAITAACIIIYIFSSAYIKYIRVIPFDEVYFVLSQIFALTLIFLFLTFQNIKIPFSNQIYKLNSRTYGIYLTHYFFLIIGSKIIFHFIPVLMRFMILYIPILFAITLGGPLLFMMIVSKSPFRKTYPYLFG